MFRDLQRLRRITGIIGKYGYESFVRRSSEGKDGITTGDFAIDSGSRPHAALEGPRRFRLMLQELGPTFIKLGQVLSSRPDLISAAYVKELKLLQDHCDALPFADIERALRESQFTALAALRRSTRRRLRPLDCAGSGRGVTADGDDVVIKVRRPGVADEVAPTSRSALRDLDAVIEESRLRARRHRARVRARDPGSNFPRGREPRRIREVPRRARTCHSASLLERPEPIVPR